MASGSNLVVGIRYESPHTRAGFTFGEVINGERIYVKLQSCSSKDVPGGSDLSAGNDPLL